MSQQGGVNPFDSLKRKKRKIHRKNISLSRSKVFAYFFLQKEKKVARDARRSNSVIIRAITIIARLIIFSGADF